MRNILILCVILASCATNPKYEKKTIFEEARQEMHYAVRMKDYKKALPKAKMLAEEGYKDGQFVFASLLLSGEFVKQDIVEGAAWLNVACESEIKDYLDFREKIFRAFKGHFKEVIEKRTAELIVKYGMKAKNIVCNNYSKAGSNIKERRCKKFLL